MNVLWSQVSEIGHGEYNVLETIAHALSKTKWDDSKLEIKHSMSNNRGVSGEIYSLKEIKDDPKFI